MPGFDHTGPRGEGPMTGGGFGLCGRPSDRPVYWGYGVGRGGWPWGGGRGRCFGGRGGGWRWFGPAVVRREPGTTAEQMDRLEADVRALSDQLAELRSRLKDRDSDAPGQRSD